LEEDSLLPTVSLLLPGLLGFATLLHRHMNFNLDERSSPLQATLRESVLIVVPK